MIILSIGCPVKRPRVLLDVSCSTKEVSYITLAIDYFERMNMLKYCKLFKIKKRNSLLKSLYLSFYEIFWNSDLTKPDSSTIPLAFYKGTKLLLYINMSLFLIKYNQKFTTLFKQSEIEYFEILFFLTEIFNEFYI